MELDPSVVQKKSVMESKSECISVSIETPEFFSKEVNTNDNEVITTSTAEKAKTDDNEVITTSKSPKTAKKGGSKNAEKSFCQKIVDSDWVFSLAVVVAVATIACYAVFIKIEIQKALNRVKYQTPLPNVDDLCFDLQKKSDMERECVYSRQKFAPFNGCSAVRQLTLTCVSTSFDFNQYDLAPKLVQLVQLTNYPEFTPCSKNGLWCENSACVDNSEDPRIEAYAKLESVDGKWQLSKKCISDTYFAVLWMSYLQFYDCSMSKRAFCEDKDYPSERYIVLGIRDCIAPKLGGRSCWEVDQMDVPTPLFVKEDCGLCPGKIDSGVMNCTTKGLNTAKCFNGKSQGICLRGTCIPLADMTLLQAE